MTVREIVEAYLRANGYDGLYAEDEKCGCSVGDIAPCGSCICGCLPGVKVRAPKGAGVAFWIGPKPEPKP